MAMVTASSTATVLARTCTLFAYLFTVVTLVYLVSSVKYQQERKEEDMAMSSNLEDLEDVLGNPKLKWAQMKSELDTHDITLTKEDIVKADAKNEAQKDLIDKVENVNDSERAGIQKDKTQIQAAKNIKNIVPPAEEPMIVVNAVEENPVVEQANVDVNQETAGDQNQKDIVIVQDAVAKDDQGNVQGGETTQNIVEAGQDFVDPETENLDQTLEAGDEEAGVEEQGQETEEKILEEKGPQVYDYDAGEDDVQEEGEVEQEAEEEVEENEDTAGVDVDGGDEGEGEGEEQEGKDEAGNVLPPLPDTSPQDISDQADNMENLNTGEEQKVAEPQTLSKQQLLSKIKNLKGGGQKTETPTTPKPLGYPKRLPDCLIIGARKAGTRAVLRWLRYNPKIKGIGQEIQFFSNPSLYAQGLEWYLEQMPSTRSDKIIVEKSAEYFHTWEAPERIHEMNPKIKLILVVREPYDRMVSDFHFLQRYAEMINHTIKYDEVDHTLEELCINQTTGQVNENYGALNRSKYAVHMKNWLNYFPLQQIHIVNGDKLAKSNPMSEMQRLEKFLNFKKSAFHDDFFYFNNTKGFWCTKKEGCLDDEKGHIFPPRDVGFVTRIKQYFQPYNQEFYNLVGIDYQW